MTPEDILPEPGTWKSSSSIG